MKITQNCIVPGMPEKVYHADPTPELVGFAKSASLSSSMLSDLIESTETEAMLNNQRLNPDFKRDDSTEGADIGTVAHDLVLRGERGTYEIVNVDAWRSNEAKAAKARIEERGLIALNTTTAERIIPVVTAMKKALHEQLAEHRDYPNIMKLGKPELSVFAFDGDIWNRARIDWLEESPGFDDLIVDYKTTGLGFDQWEKQVLWGESAKYIQNKHYRRSLSLLTGKEHRFVFVVQRIKPPFLVRVIEIDRSCYEELDKRYMNGYRRFFNCIKTGKFNGEIPRTFHSYPPPWITQRWENDEVNAHMMEEKSETVPAPNGDLLQAG